MHAIKAPRNILYLSIIQNDCMSEQQTFLLIDDDSDDSMLFKEVLESVSANTQFFHVLNGKDALQFLKENTHAFPDIIFLDLNMPGMSGKDCLKAIKSTETLSNTEVIIYTTSSLRTDIESVLQLGAVGFITKPSSLKDLKSILSFICNNRTMDLRKRLEHLRQTFSFIRLNHSPA
jgi:CheY-like chemotaxis protein